MFIPPVDTPNPPAFTPTGPDKFRGDGERDPVEHATAGERVASVGRRVRRESRDPNLDPARLRRQRGEPALDDQNRSVDAADDNSRGSGGRHQGQQQSRRDGSAASENGGRAEAGGEGYELSEQAKAERQALEQLRDLNLRAEARQVPTRNAGHPMARSNIDTLAGPDGWLYGEDGQPLIEIGGESQEDYALQASLNDPSILAVADPTTFELGTATAARRIAANNRMLLVRLKAEALRQRENYLGTRVDENQRLNGEELYNLKASYRRGALYSGSRASIDAYRAVAA